MDFSNLITVTGRIQTFIESPEKGTMPVSCTNYLYKNDLYSLLEYISVALRGGAGIDVNLSNFVANPPKDIDWYWYLDEGHLEHDIVPAEYRSLFLTDSVDDVLDCTFIYVNDSMEEDKDYLLSIHNSWKAFIEGLLQGKRVYVDLSAIRPIGTTNSVGLEASGAISFLSIFYAIAEHIKKGDLISLMQCCGTINEVLRRGGSYKNGIVTFSLDQSHSNIIEYLNIPLKELPGSAKKKIYIGKELLEDKRLKKLVEVRVNDKSLMLTKRLPKELVINVCQGIIFKAQGSCLILHVNLAQVESLDQIIEGFKGGMRALCNLHYKWPRHPQYASPEEDNQVALGIVGLANFLAYHNISYVEFIEALEYKVYRELKLAPIPSYTYTGKSVQSGFVKEVVDALHQGYMEATKIALEYGLERAFTIEPTQSCAYRYKDLKGNTVCKNINPPLAKRVRRTSHTVKDLSGWFFHGNVEVIQDLVEQGHIDGTDYVQRLWEAFQLLMNSTGLAHTVSFDLYRTIDQDWLHHFLTDSPLWTTYYMVADKIDQSYLNKGDINSFCAFDDPEGCSACGE